MWVKGTLLHLIFDSEIQKNLISTEVVSHTTKFSFFTICSEGEQNDTITTTASHQAPSIQQKQVEKDVEK
jgi:hypothetical protein